MKRCAVINDISGFGRCSLTAGLPVLATMQVEANPVVTAVLSNQTGYDSYYMNDLSDYILHLIEEWKKLNVSFDGILTGFIGNENQFDYVEQFIKEFKKPNTILVVDPVMADDGEKYANYSDDMCNRVRSLCQLANVITPNATELSIICNKKYSNDLEVVAEYAKSLITNQLSTVIVTGIINDDSVSNLCVSKNNVDVVSCKYVKKASFSGTGDLFATVITGALLNGMTAVDAVKLAQKFLSNSIASTGNIDTRNGIDFEKHLEELL
jgi:pyridoxine kinase